MIGLETDRLIFRQWKSEDFSALASFFSDEKNACYVGGIKNREESWRTMATYIGHYELLGYSYLALEEKASSKLVGTVGLWNSETWPEPELGYWLLPETQGKGFGTEAGEAAKKYASNKAKLESLVSYIDSTNESSINLALRLGARLDGELELLEFGKHQVYRYW